MAALLREDVNLPRLECSHPLPVRDDQGIWENLLRPVEPFGREEQPDRPCQASSP